MSGFYRGPGGTGDATGDAVNQASIAIDAANAASTSASSASSSASSASSSASAAAASAVAAAASAASASTTLASSLLKANNLSDLSNVSTARTNLGLVASATTDTTNATNIASGTLAAARLPAFTGDATATAGTSALTLATVNSNVGTFGSSSAIPVFTVNAKGLVTAVSTASISAGGNASVKNRLINSGFIINQRGYVSGTSLASGVYAHDRFKAGSGGCTYTFTAGSTGVPITITITAGSLQQVIEGCNLPEGGTYVLSWTGTAQARYNGGSYSSSPLAITGITAGANTTIEWNTGTLSVPQMEYGSTASGYDYHRPFTKELILCQRYYEKSFNQTTTPAQNVAQTAGCLMYGLQAASTQYIGAVTTYAVVKRAAPTIVTYNPFAASAGWSAAGAGDYTATVYSGGTSNIGLRNDTNMGATASGLMLIHWTASAEL